MATKPKKKCEHCGATMHEYRHGMSPVLVSGLRAIAASGCAPVRLSEIVSDRTVLDNFQKLKYWGLVERVRDGVWKITERGVLFLAGERMVPEHVWTYRGEVRRSSSTCITIDSVKGRTKVRSDYAANSRPVEE